MALKKRGRWVAWGGLLVLAVLSTVRFVLLASNLEPGDGLDLVLLIAVGGILMFGGIFIAAARSIGRGLPELRALYPQGVAVAVGIRTDSLDSFQALTGVSLGERGRSMDATFERQVVRFWRGRKPRLVAEITADALEFTFGDITTVAGSFPALLMTVRSENQTHTLRFVRMNEYSRWFPRQLNREQTEELVAQLNEHAGVPPAAHG